MNLTYFCPKIKRECGKQKQQPRQHQISEIYLRTSHVMSCYNIRSGNTGINEPELLVQSGGRRDRTATLFRRKA